jgi:hypothetical protein
MYLFSVIIESKTIEGPIIGILTEPLDFSSFHSGSRFYLKRDYSFLLIILRDNYYATKL